MLSACAAEPIAPPPPPPVAIIEATPAPLPVIALSESTAKIKRNGTLSQLLRDEKIAEQDQWIASLASVIDLRKLRASDAFHLFRDETGALKKLVLDRSVWERAIVAVAAPDVVVPPLADAPVPPLRFQGALAAKLERDPTVVKTELMEIEITSSLYQALVDGDWDPAIAFDLADVFAWDLDFYSDVQRGDRVLALVDVRRREGESNAFIAYGKLHGAIYAGEVGRFSAYRYTTPSGEDTFYDENGRSLRKEFLKSPLKYAHVTSRFGSRKHPVLGYTRQHAGIDFAASVGTPVWAVGDGKVTFAGWQGGYGKFVTVRHPNGLETAYAHLSQINVRVGQHIAQKTVVGMSGNTGLSSGPHLHFGLKRGGQFINPFSLKPIRVEPLAADELPRFKEAIDGVMKRLGEALQQRT
ncbi:MAG: M23 family metallopeptidase [Deltaproteobacteria bacterium]|nr:M23 family metallopeptidase [Deltaproteobacteria bacterium]